MKKGIVFILLLLGVAAAEYPSGYFYIIFRGDTICVRPVITDSVTEAEWFDYTSASIHTGLETAYETHFFFFYNPYTGNIGMVFQHNIDEYGTSDANCDLYLDGLPDSCEVIVSDDPSHDHSHSTGRPCGSAQEFDLDCYPQGGWWWYNNTDGGAMTLPRSEWQFTMRFIFGGTDPIRTYWFLSGDDGSDKILLDTVYTGQEDTLVVGHGFLEVITFIDSLDFADVNVAYAETLSYPICNSFETVDTLRIGEIDYPDPAVFSVLYAPSVLAPGACEDMIIVFHPPDSGFFADTIVLHTNVPCDSVTYIPLFGHGVQPGIDSVWFSEETDCDGQNVVEVCYTLFGDADQALPVTVSFTPDTAGGVWLDFADYTISDAEGDMGEEVYPGTHCFTWLASEDMPGLEKSDFAVRVDLGIASGETGRWSMFQFDVANTGRCPYLCCTDWSVLDTLWSYDVGAPIRTAAVYDEDHIYFVSSDGVVHCVSSEGDVVWETDIGAETYAGLALLSDGKVVVADDANTVTAINPDGTVAWTYTSSLTTAGFRSYITVDDDNIYLTGFYDGWNGVLTALSPAGTLLWEINIPGSGTWSRCAPALDSDGRIFVVDFHNAPGQLSCFDEDGTVLWQFNDYPPVGETDLLSSPTLDGLRSRVYFGSNKSDPRGMVAVDYSASGASLAWFYDVGSGHDVNYSPALDAYGNLYFGAKDSVFYSLTPDGELRWSAAVDGIPTDPIVDAGGHVIFAAGSHIYIFDTDGDSLWSITLGGTVAPPIIGQSGNIYVGTTAGVFYALGKSLPLMVDSAFAFGPVDTRPPQVDVVCPEDTVFYSDTVLFVWSISDLFPTPAEPCTVVVGCCESTFVYVGEDSLLWTPPLLNCDSAFIAIAASDSFCNWGYDTCWFSTMAQGYVSLSMPETTVLPCDTVGVPVRIDSMGLPFTSEILIQFRVNDVVVLPVGFVPGVSPAPDSVALFGSGDLWSVLIRWDSRVFLAGDLLGYINLEVNCDAVGGDFSVIHIDTVIADLIDVSWTDGVVIVDYTPDPWLLEVRFDDMCGGGEGLVALGNAYGALDGYDGVYDLLYLPPSPGDLDVYIELADSLYPSISRLRRSICDMEPLNEWRIVVGGGEVGCSVYVHWDVGDLGEGEYLLNGYQDMRVDSDYVAYVGETLEVVWYLPELGVYRFGVSRGWNLLSLCVLNPGGRGEVLFGGSYAGPFGYDCERGSYYYAERVRVGEGYWVFYLGAGDLLEVGVPVHSYERDVCSGWVLLGSVMDSLVISDIDLPFGVELLGLWRWDSESGVYYMTEELLPCRGYWGLFTGGGRIKVGGE